MSALIRAFVSIGLLRMPPQQLPASTLLLGLVIVLDLAITPLTMQYTLAPPLALMVALTELVFLATFINVALTMKNLRARFVQTLTAIEGVDVLMMLLAWLPTHWFYMLKQAGAPTVLPALVLFFLLIWNVVIIAHILRHALSTVMPVAIMLALGYVILSTYIVSALFPVN